MSTPRLHVYDPSSEGPSTSQPARRDYPPVESGDSPEPIPLLYRLTQHELDGRPYTDQLVVWDNRDGARCRWCAADACTFQPGNSGVGSCIVRRPGAIGVGSPPLFTRSR